MAARPRSPLYLLAAAATLLAAPPAGADVKTAAWHGDDDFSYEILHMPDLDQRRAWGFGVIGLPGNGGMHCVPTSSMNMLAYAANHGFPDVDPFPNAWQGQANYNTATLKILALGFDMGTNTQTGTGGKGWYDGLVGWLAPSNELTVTQYTASGYYAPRALDLAKSAIAGSLVSFAYGRYEVVGDNGGVFVVERDGGHIVTLSKAHRVGVFQKLWSRDPAAPNDGQLTTQSVFGNTEYSIFDMIVNFDADGVPFRSMSALNFPFSQFDPETDKLRLIDQYVALRPKLGYSWKPSPQPNLGQIDVFSAHTNPTHSPDHVLPVQGTLVDVVIDPDQLGFMALVDGGAAGAPKLVHVDLLTGAAETLELVPGARKLAFGRNRELYVAGDTALRMYERNGAGWQSTQVPLPFAVDAIAVDDAADEVVMLSAAGRRIMRVAVGLHAPLTHLVLPAALPLNGAPTLAVDPRTGLSWIGSANANGVYGVFVDAAGTPQVEALLLPAVQKVTAIEVDDGGHLFVVANGALVELAPGAAGSGWQPVASDWSGFAIGDQFRLTHSRTNFDPATMSGPEWRNLSDAELAAFDDVVVPDCESAPSDVRYGAGKPGTHGVPRLDGNGVPALGQVAGIQIDGGLPGATPILFLGFEPLAAPFDGGMLLVNPAVVTTLPALDGEGHFAIETGVPEDPHLCGLTLFLQAVFADPGASGHYGVAMTNGLARSFGG